MMLWCVFLVDLPLLVAQIGLSCCVCWAGSLYWMLGPDVDCVCRELSFVGCEFRWGGGAQQIAGLMLMATCKEGADAGQTKVRLCAGMSWLATATAECC